MRRRAVRIVAALLVFAAAGVGAGLATGQAPPPPDFYWPYGRVSIGGANLVPASQPLVAIINGRACGNDTTRLALEGPGVPAADAGRTVYVVSVLADGSGAGQAPGCGRNGDAPRLWFPLAGYLSEPLPGFQVGGVRADLDLVTRLAERRALPMLASEGTY